jgi:hypothetical protein
MLGMFALVYGRELPDASSLMTEGFRQALMLDRWMPAGIADRLLDPPVDLLARIGRPEQAIEQYRLVLARQPSQEAAHRALRSVGIAVLDAAPRP